MSKIIENKGPPTFKVFDKLNLVSFSIIQEVAVFLDKVEPLFERKIPNTY